MKITVIGTGYVGLVTGVGFSEYGFNVTCVDKDKSKIERLERCDVPIYEPGLSDIVERNVAAGRLDFTSDLAAAVKDANIILIAVGTPTGENGLPDMTAFNAVADQLIACVKGPQILIVKSTVPVGTCRALQEKFTAACPGVMVASNPEFLREGSAIKDFMQPERIIVGVEAAFARQAMAKLYEPICQNNNIPLFNTTFESAELIKYASNSFLATKIAFINEMADLCESLGANIRDVARGMGMDSRIGSKFLQTGPGYGGSCFPKDTLALVHLAGKAGAPSRIVEAVIDSNETRKHRMVKKIIKAMDGCVADKTIAVLGLTFKPGTDDMRDSSSLVILPALMQEGAIIRAYDPQGMNEAAKMMGGNITWCKDAYDALENADSAVILTEWNEFRSLDLNRVKNLLRAPLVIDLRNVYKRREMLVHGFHYVSIGRADVKPGSKLQDMAVEAESAA